MRRVVRAAALAAVAALSYSCGGNSTRSALPECADADATIERPDALPAEFPLPEGTVFVEKRDAGRFTLVDARSPGELHEVREFFERELPDAGFQLSGSEAEEHEAETDFAGNGVTGRLVLRRMGDCEGAVRVGVATAAG